MFKPPTNVPESVPINASSKARILMGEKISASDLNYLVALFVETVKECDFSKFLCASLPD